MESAQASPPQVTVIEPPKAWPLPDLREIRDHRDLLYYLARRDVVVRYRQAIVGVLWAILQPLVLAGSFTLFLGHFLKIAPPEGIPYGLFAVSGMVMWLLFTEGLFAASKSTVEGEALISRIYFPRLVLPIAALAPALVDFAFGFVVVLCVGFAYGFVPDVRILAVPFIVALAVLTALGAGLWLSALNVKYRDVLLVVPTVILVGLFITPITYPFDIVPEFLQPFYSLNPMVGVLEAFRWSMFGTAWPGILILPPVAMSLILLFTGFFYFKRTEQTFADFI